MLNKKPIRSRNIVILGLGRHGKDTVAEICRDLFGLEFKASSKFCSELFIFDKLKDKYDYIDERECFDDRYNHRSEWFNLITKFNSEDKTRLGREIFNTNNVYVGLRNENELLALKIAGIVDHVVWVDAKKRLGITEDNTSNTLLEYDADYIIDNNGTVAELKQNIFHWLMEIL